MSRLFNIIALIFLSAGTILSQTPISGGNVSGTWAVSGSPFQVNGDIVIPFDSTLTIEPGVNYSILFTVNDTTGFSNPESTDGGWRGISFLYTSSANDTSKIIHCKLEHGKAVGPSFEEYSGGAIRVFQSNKVIISNCLIEQNMAWGGSEGGLGGGIRIDNCSNITISKCIFRENGDQVGGGIMVWGNSNLSIIDCELINNHALDVIDSGIGGGICSFNDENLKIENTILKGNTATFGGGMNFYQSNPELINNLLINNDAVAGGAILFNGNSHAALINNTIVENYASDGTGGILCHEDSHPILVNTILFGNTEFWGSQIQIWDDESEPAFYFCDVEGGTDDFPGDDNFDSDPLFNEETEGDYSLSDFSPCIGSGASSAVNDGEWFYAPDTDIEGNPRPDPPESNPDIGAYENSMAAPHHGIISCSPESFHMDLTDVRSDSQIVTISNTGLGELQYSVRTNYTTRADSLNYALSFDGSGHYVNIVNPESFNMNSDFTFTAWIKTESAGVILAKTRGEDEEGPKTFFVNPDGKLALDVGWVGFFEGTKIISDNLWHHVAASVEFNGDDFIKFYIDGVLDAQGQEMDVDFYPEDDFGLRIGSDEREVESFPHFQGMIDEVSVWDRVLTDTEIKMSMLKSFTGSESGLVGYWRFNENSGTIAYDQTTNANDGTFQGDVVWAESNAPVDPWVYIMENPGTVGAESSIEVKAYIDATKLKSGEYAANLVFASNDPDNPEETVLVTFSYVTGFDGPFSGQLPATFALHQNYPNPFNPRTMINYQLPMISDVELSIYNLLGQKIATLISQRQSAGTYQIEWDAGSMASGVYYYIIRANEFHDVKKMILVR
jgi:hypothetical protein